MHISYLQICMWRCASLSFYCLSFHAPLCVLAVLTNSEKETWEEKLYIYGHISGTLDFCVMHSFVGIWSKSLFLLGIFQKKIYFNKSYCGVLSDLNQHSLVAIPKLPKIPVGKYNDWHFFPCCISFTENVWTLNFFSNHL